MKGEQEDNEDDGYLGKTMEIRGRKKGIAKGLKRRKKKPIK